MKPILVNTEMVCAIQNGTKTVTRRVLKPQPKKNKNGVWVFKDVYWINGLIGLHSHKMDEYAPYKREEILYVRETFWKDNEGRYYYRADDDLIYFENDIGYGFGWYQPKWSPSIHMPREAARIFLRVTDVRIERLQNIDDEGAKAEGANWRNGKHVGVDEKMRSSAIERFQEIWDSTIKTADRAIYGWDANP